MDACRARVIDQIEITPHLFCRHPRLPRNRGVSSAGSGDTDPRYPWNLSEMQQSDLLFSLIDWEISLFLTFARMDVMDMMITIRYRLAMPER